MHRAGDARIVGTHEHLGEQLDVPVLPPFPGILLSQRVRSCWMFAWFWLVGMTQSLLTILPSSSNS